MTWNFGQLMGFPDYLSQGASTCRKEQQQPPDQELLPDSKAVAGSLGQGDHTEPSVEVHSWRMACADPSGIERISPLSV